MRHIYLSKTWYTKLFLQQTAQTAAKIESSQKTGPRDVKFFLSSMDISIRNINNAVPSIGVQRKTEKKDIYMKE